MTYSGLLNGIVVLDFGERWAAPICARILSDMGADILKVERYKIGDASRINGLFPIDGTSGAYIALNASKKSISIDATAPEGLKVVREIVPRVDIVLESNTPGWMKKMGLDYDSLSLLKPDLIYCSIAGFGQYGPYRDWVCLAPLVEAMAGRAYVTGDPDGPPMLSGTSPGDTNAGIQAATAILGALFYRSRTGTGQYIDISMLDAQIFLDWSAVPMAAIAEGKYKPKRWGQHRDTIVPYGVYECKGEYVVLEITGPTLWERFCKVIGQPDMITDPRFDTNAHRMQNKDECIRRIRNWFDQQPSNHEAATFLQKNRIPCAAVRSPAEVCLDPNTKERELFRKVYHPIMDREAPVPVTPYKYSKTPIKIEEGAPLLGQHNEEILKRFLSYSDDQIKGLYERHILYQDPRVLELRDRGKI